MNSVGSVDDGCLGLLRVHLSFIVQETIGDLAPATTASNIVTTGAAKKIQKGNKETILKETRQIQTQKGNKYKQETIGDLAPATTASDKPQLGFATKYKKKPGRHMYKKETLETL